jgi:beta-lactamase regulating signal transducer with metallopeptidase domain
MTPFGTSHPLSLEIFSGLVQGVILGIALVAVASLALRRLVRLNASTRFAVWIACLVVVSAMALVPAVRHLQKPVNGAPILAHAERVSAPKAQPAPQSKLAAQPPQPLEPATEPRVALQLPVDRDLPAAATTIYLLVVVCLCVRLLLSYGRLRRLKRHARPAPPELSARFERWLRLSGCRRHVTLLVSGEAAGPLAAGFLRPAVIVPDSLLLQITAEELDDIGVHELAHLRRYDDWTTLIQRLFRTLLFFHPAVHWICRQLEFDREVACDDSVLAVTNGAKPYARSLAKIAETARFRSGPVLASGAAFRKSQIARRIELLLDRARDRRPNVSGVSFALVVLIILGIASEFMQLPAFVSMVEGGSYHRSRWTSDGRTVRLEMAGEIEFGDDDVSIAHMSPNAVLRIEERTGWSGRKVEIRNGDSGKPEIRYFLHGREHPLDEPGKAWLAGILPRIIRDTGIHAEERARRILEQKGPDALFGEIDRISGDNVRRRYLLAAIESGRLTTEDMRRALRSASRVSSDHDKANLLMEASREGLKSELRSYFFDAVNTISSDHDRRRVLAKAIADAGSDSGVMTLAARAAAKMSSDHDKAEVLKQMPFDALMKDAGAREAILRAASTIQSDHDKSRVLERIVETQAASPEAVPEILRVAEGMQSDSDKSRLLGQLPGEAIAGDPARGSYFAAVRTIQGDSDRARVLTGFLRRAELNPEVLDEVCNSVQGMSSDHEKANVLAAAGSSLPPACFAAVRTISSDHDKRRVLERVLKTSESPETARAAVEAASSLSSDHDKAEVLICAAARYPDDTTRALIRKVAEGVSSDSDYRRVTAKLLDRTP